MPLAACLLALLTLIDRFAPSALRPELPNQAETRVGVRASYEGVVTGPPVYSDSGWKVVVSGLFPDEGDRVSVLLTLAEAPSEPIERGDRVAFTARLKRPPRYKNPGGFDYRAYLARRGILLTGFLENSADLRRISRGGDPLKGFDRFRTRLREALNLSITAPARGFLAALLLGDASGIDPKTFEDFRDTGTSHLIAVSGQHIAVVGVAAFAVFWWLLRRSERFLLRFSARKLALGLALLPITAFTLLAGSPPSAVRAAILAGLAALAVALDRRPDGLSALAAAAIAIAALNPSAPFSASFQLSFLAVLGIMIFRTNGIGGFAGKYIINPFWMTVGATLATAPLVAYRFHDISLSGFLVNLAAVPASGLLLVTGLAAALPAILLPSLGLPLLKTVGLLTGLFLQALHTAADWSRAGGLVFSFYPTEAEVFVGFAAVALIAVLRRRPGLKPALSLGLLLTVWAASSFISWPRSDLEVVFLDVGQGDATLVLTPSGKSLLVDGGGFLVPGASKGPSKNRFDVGREVVVPYLKRRGLKKIDAVLLSHPHPDHFGGLTAVFETFQVGEFWWSGQKFPDASFAALLEAVRRNGASVKILKGGDRFEWTGVRIETFYPTQVSPGRSINDNSLVVRLSLGAASVLFPGDVEKDGEAALADRVRIDASLLKIPHHASRTSSSVPFIESVGPSAAVASLGEENLFGFPHQGILEKYERRGIQVFRTDRDGAVTVRLSPELPRRSPSIRTFSSEE